MKEITDIVSAYSKAAALKKKTALATVVHVEGSSYRREGARMLITEDGELTGAISGGCLEGDALRKARLVMTEEKSKLVMYDTTDDDDAKLGVGLGCNGIIYILIEPIFEHPNNQISLLKAVIANRGDAVLVTLFSMQDKNGVQPGTLLCCINNIVKSNEFADPTLLQSVKNDAYRVLGLRSSETIIYPDGIGYTGFIEYVKPLISLVIAGAGNDAVPLTKIADVLGWEIIVVDGRYNYATPERFPLAGRVLVSKPGHVTDHLELSAHTAFVLMTHNYNYEMELLSNLLPLKLPYIGILGPKKKIERMLTDIRNQGIAVSEEESAAVYGPVGLDIGSENAEEIALSIAAEIKAIFSKREGYSLKNKPTSIHLKALSKN